MTPLELDPVAALLFTGAVALLMVLSGVEKSLLTWRRPQVCPGCRHRVRCGRCGCD